MLTRRFHRDEEGITLVELLVVMVLLGVVGTVTVAGIVTALGSTSATTERLDARHELEVALQQASRDLRAAAPYVLSQNGDFGTELSTCLTWGGTPELITYRSVVEDGQELLVQDTHSIEAGTKCDPAAGGSSRTLVTNIDNGSEPIFRYYDSQGEEILCDEPDPADCGSAYLSAATIGIHLQRDLDGKDSVTGETRVTVRSIRYGSSS
jgi:type II secretory pathway pseudopilin PulG